MKYVILRSSDSYYFTGEGIHNGQEGFGTWSPFPKFAKTYTKRGWAKKAALKWGGIVVMIGDHYRTSKNDEQPRQRG